VYAKTHRYDEEVRLLQEEMRHTVACGVTEAAEWDGRVAEELPGA
jgi:phage gp36-like protein